MGATIYTTGGTAPEGSQCHFPFDYQDLSGNLQTYVECTDVDHDQLWCYTDADYTQWGNCIIAETTGGTAPEGSVCDFPFQYGGTTYWECTDVDRGRNWCFVDEAEIQWGYCVSTDGSGSGCNSEADFNHRCGDDFSLTGSGLPVICSPGRCCSSSNWCGGSSAHCEDSVNSMYSDGICPADEDTEETSSEIWEYVGYGGCTGGNWINIGTANSLEEAQALMLTHDQCSKDQSMLFYSEYSYTSSWGVRCATAEHHEDCMESNPNWQEYILHLQNLWVTRLVGSFCTGTWNVHRKQIQGPTSEEECQAAVESDPDCGTTMYFCVAPTEFQCRCVLTGQTCTETAYSQYTCTIQDYTIPEEEPETCTSHLDCSISWDWNYEWWWYYYYGYGHYYDHHVFDGKFCHHGICAPCEDCHYCDDGIDGSCGHCGDGFPTEEDADNCEAGNPELTFCFEHDDCPVDVPFCFEGVCALCSECHWCLDGIDDTCGPCGDGYPLYEDGPCDNSDTMQCGAHADCLSEDTFCTSDGTCASCDQCRYCSNGIDRTCDSCGNGYPLWENSACFLESVDTTCVYVVSGFRNQTHLNGEYYLRTELVNDDWSYVEIGIAGQSGSFLSRGHNGEWWWDDDLSDFEHDSLNPDGVWAWSMHQGNIFKSTEQIDAFEWMGTDWTPVRIGVTKHCTPCTFTVSGFTDQPMLNGVYVQRPELVNLDLSFAEENEDTILARGHNGYWWFDIDILDFEHDEMDPNGVWAWVEPSVNLFLTSQTVTANEWNGEVWSPVSISIEKECGADMDEHTIYVGNDAIDRISQDTGLAMQFVSEYHIEENGKLTSWEIYAFRADTVILQVYRQERTPLRYHLVGSTTVTATVGFNQVDANINVQAGDVLGWYCSGVQPIKFANGGGRTVRRSYGYTGFDQTISVTNHEEGWEREYSIRATIEVAKWLDSDDIEVGDSGVCADGKVLQCANHWTGGWCRWDCAEIQTMQEALDADGLWALEVHDADSDGWEGCHYQCFSECVACEGTAAYWIELGFGECSESCGDGTQTQVVVCSTGNNEDCAADTRPLETRTCNAGECPTNGCHMNFESHGDSCYYLGGLASGFYDVKSQCEDMGAHMLKISSQQEWDRILEAWPSSSFWLGLMRDGPSQSWYWVDDGSPLTFDAWKEGQADPNSEHYAFYIQGDGWHSGTEYDNFHQQLVACEVELSTMQTTYPYLFDGCCRGGAAISWMNMGEMSHMQCEVMCDMDDGCNAIETNGWLTDPENASGLCYLFYGDSDAEVTNGQCVTSGDQKCFRKPSRRTTTGVESTTPPPLENGATYVCANEWETCECSGIVRYGADDSYSDWQEVTGSIPCTNDVFGDPTPNVVKHCQCSPINTCQYAPNNGFWVKIYQIMDGTDRTTSSFPLTVEEYGDIGAPIGSENAKLSDWEINTLAQPMGGYSHIYRIQSSDLSNDIFIRTQNEYSDTEFNFNIGDDAQFNFGSYYLDLDWFTGTSRDGYDLCSCNEPFSRNECERFFTKDSLDCWQGPEASRCFTGGSSCDENKKLEGLAIWIYATSCNPHCDHSVPDEIVCQTDYDRVDTPAMAIEHQLPACRWNLQDAAKICHEQRPVFLPDPDYGFQLQIDEQNLRVRCMYFWSRPSGGVADSPSTQLVCLPNSSTSSTTAPPCEYDRADNLECDDRIDFLPGVSYTQIRVPTPACEVTLRDCINICGLPEHKPSWAIYGFKVQFCGSTHSHMQCMYHNAFVEDMSAGVMHHAPGEGAVCVATDVTRDPNSSSTTEEPTSTWQPEDCVDDTNCEFILTYGAFGNNACVDYCDSEGMIHVIRGPAECWLPEFSYSCRATCSADTDVEFTCGSTPPTDVKQYRYMGCRNNRGGDWVRPFGDVSTTIDGALSCRDQCHEAGYDYFGLECSMETAVHCQCTNADFISDLLSEERCLTDMEHCTGPHQISDGDVEYILGSAWSTSMYSTHMADPAPFSPDYTLAGCYSVRELASLFDDRDMSVGAFPNNVESVIRCHDTCLRLNMPYFGLECAEAESVGCNCYPSLDTTRIDSEVRECVESSSTCPGPFTQSNGPNIYIMGSESSVAVYETYVGSAVPTERPTDSPTETEFTFITSGTCEAAGYFRITDSTTCQLAAEMLGWDTFSFSLHPSPSNNGRPGGCVRHQFGNLELFTAATGDCDSWGWSGCYCLTSEIAANPTVAPTRSERIIVHYDEPLSWEDSRAECIKLGGDLVIPTDAQFVSTFCGSSPCWIGATALEDDYGFGIREDGWCVQSNWQPPLWDEMAPPTVSDADECKAWCEEQPDLTGCEFRWGQSDAGCYAHRGEVSHGNGADLHYCWVYGNSNAFYYVDGTHTNQTVLSGGDCGLMMPVTSGWVAESCESLNGYLCELPGAEWDFVTSAWNLTDHIPDAYPAFYELKFPEERIVERIRLKLKGNSIGKLNGANSGRIELLAIDFMDGETSVDPVAADGSHETQGGCPIRLPENLIKPFSSLTECQNDWHDHEHDTKYQQGPQGQGLWTGGAVLTTEDGMETEILDFTFLSPTPISSLQFYRNTQDEYMERFPRNIEVWAHLGESPCVDGWEYISGSCFKVFEDEMSALEAENSCLLYDSHLATIVSTIQNNELVSMIQNMRGSPHIGLYNMDGVLHWRSGHPVTYQHETWGMTAYDCHVLTSNGIWERGPCETRTAPYICSYSCLQGWTEISGSCYKIFDLEETFVIGDAFCQASHPNSHLATVESSIQNSGLAWLLDSVARGGKAYIGLRRTDTGYEWRSQASNAYSIDVLSDERGDCVQIMLQDNSAVWVTSDCSTHQYFACSYPVTGQYIAPQVEYRLVDGGRNVNFETARALCQENGATLPLVYTSEKNALLDEACQRITNDGYDCAWLGLTCPLKNNADCAHEENWMWTDGLSLPDSPFQSTWRQSFATSNEFCAHQWYTGDTNSWAPHSCSATIYNAVCEFDPSKEYTPAAMPTMSPRLTHPSRYPISSHPSRYPISTQPTHDPVSTHPSRKPFPSHPSRNPMASFPSTSPASKVVSPDSPSREPIASFPTHDPVTKIPTDKPVSTRPSANPVSEFPTRFPLTSMPTRFPVAKVSVHPSRDPLTTFPSRDPYSIQNVITLRLDGNYDEVFAKGTNLRNEFRSECTQELSEIGDGTGVCLGIWKGSIMVSVQGSMEDLDKISDHVDSNGLTLPTFGTFFNHEDSDTARVVESDTDSSNLRFIAILFAIVIVCMVFALVFYCRTQKKILVTEIRHVNGYGEEVAPPVIYSDAGRRGPESRALKRDNSEGFYRDPITATEPFGSTSGTIYRPKLNANTYVGGTEFKEEDMTMDIEGNSTTGGFWPGEIITPDSNQETIDEHIEGTVKKTWM